MTIRLKELLQKYSSVPKTDAELEQGMRFLLGFAKSLLAMKQEISENESGNINKGINQNAGGRAEPYRPEQPAF